MVGRTLLLQLARERKVRVSDADVNAERGRRWGASSNMICGSGMNEAIAADLMLERITAELTRHVPRPSRSGVEQFYRTHQSMYRLSEAVLAAHIFRETASEAQAADAEEALRQAETELTRGRPFEQVANRWSDCKNVGGAVGWVTRGLMVQEFEDVVFRLAPGERSRVFRTVFGLHIAKVLRKRKEGVRPFEEVRFEIAKKLHADQRQTVLSGVIAGLESRSEIRFTEGAHG